MGRSKPEPVRGGHADVPSHRRPRQAHGRRLQPAEQPDGRLARDRPHTDGAGFFASHAGNPRPTNGLTNPSIEHEQLVEDELLANGVLTGLVELAAHAEITLASGTALVLAGVHGIAPARPTYLGHARRGFGDAYNETPLTQRHEPVPGALPLDLLTGRGRPAVAPASRLCDQIGQAFGVAELGQFSLDGLIRAPYFAAVQHPAIRERIAAAGFEITNDA